MDTRIATKNYRLNQWTEIVRDCTQSGMKVDEYCEAHGITHHQYYYWLKKVRQAALSSQQANDFIEITDYADPPCDTSEAAAVLSINGFDLKISNNASSDFIKKLLGAVQDA